jgi:hypothetical protein
MKMDASRIRSIAENADPWTRKLLLELAEEYDAILHDDMVKQQQKP